MTDQQKKRGLYLLGKKAESESEYLYAQKQRVSELRLSWLREARDMARVAYSRWSDSVE